jgi:hypothetical protein
VDLRPAPDRLTLEAHVARMMLGLVLLLIALPAMAQRTDLYDGAVSIQLPSGFRPMTQAEISQKYPTTQPPQFAFTDSDRFTQTIAFGRRRTPPGDPPPLAEVGATMQRQIAGLKGITMRQHGPLEIGGRPWYAVEFQSTAIDQQVENLMRITVADQHLLIVTANVISRSFPQYEARLRAALASLVLR